MPFAGRLRPSARSVSVACAAFAAFFWATNFILGAAVIDAIPPASLVFLRWGLAAVPLLVVAQIMERPDWSAVRRHFGSQFLQGALGMAIAPLFLYMALQHTSAFNASFVGSVNPILIALAAAVFLGERLTARVGLGAVMACTGVVAVLFGGNAAAAGAGATGVGLGELMMCGNLALWVVYTMLGRKSSPEVPPMTATAVQATIAAVVALALTPLEGGPVLPATGPQWLAIAGIAAFPSLVAYLLWARALRGLEAGSAGAFLALNPVVVAVFTVAMGQSVSALQIFGGAVVIGGVLLANGVTVHVPRWLRHVPGASEPAHSPVIQALPQAGVGYLR